jgi:hypothetical protein
MGEGLVTANILDVRGPACRRPAQHGGDRVRPGHPCHRTARGLVVRSK